MLGVGRHCPRREPVGLGHPNRIVLTRHRGSEKWPFRNGGQVTNRQDCSVRAQPLTQGRRLELITLGWNVLGLVVRAIAVIQALCVALVGFAVDR
jgi:hypothetical protein